MPLAKINEKIMEDINILPELLSSNKRMEYLIEELIFQQIMSRFPDESQEFYNDKLNIALKNVSLRIDAYVQNFAPNQDKK